MATTPPRTNVHRGESWGFEPVGKLALSASEAGSSFQCKLDRKPFTVCTAKFKAKKLKPGQHVLVVKAVDAAGNADPAPAKRVFKVG